MRFLLRVLAVLILVYAGLAFVRRLLGSGAPAPSRPRAAGGHLVKDPVCGTYIPQETAVREGDQFFCSEECRAKFIQS